MLHVHAAPSQKQEYFIKSHILAYEFYEGVPKVMVPDNLKSAIIKNNKNEIYRIITKNFPRKPF